MIVVKSTDENPMSSRLRPKNRLRVVHAPDHRIIVTVPDGNGRLLKVMARSVLIIMAVIAFPWIRSTVGSIENDHANHLDAGRVDDYYFLPILFRELSDEGLLRSGSRGILISEVGASVLQDMEMDLVVYDSGAQFQISIPNDSVDIVFADRFAEAAGFIERVLKIGGIAAALVNEDAADDFWVPPNYKIVYVHHFDKTVVAMQKEGQAALQPRKVLLCGEALDARKALMSGLEDVLLEPPRLNSAELDHYLERTKYLPDLMGDSLDGYPRRVFVDVGLPAAEWFDRHYPTRSQVFDIYNKIGPQMESGLEAAAPAIRISDWLRTNVKDEEFVVVKAEADVVEEMVKSKAICLVDELFLECKHRGLKGSKANQGRRAYWECLALLGHLRNEGIAVHQWWG